MHRNTDDEIEAELGMFMPLADGDTLTVIDRLPFWPLMRLPSVQIPVDESNVPPVLDTNATCDGSGDTICTLVAVSGPRLPYVMLYWMVSPTLGFGLETDIAI